MTTTLDLDGSGLLAIFLLALTCNVAFALHDSFFKKPSPEEVAMAVNIASLTVKAAEVRAPRGTTTGRECGCGMCGVTGERGIRCWAAAVACLAGEEGCAERAPEEKADLP